MFDHDVTLVLSESNLALVEELRTTRESIKILKARESDIRDALLQELQGTDQGVTASGVPVITIDRQVRSRVDSDRLQALHKAVYDDCLTETTVQTVRLPEAI